MKVSRLGEFYGLRTAWHGPGDVAPVGHTAHGHIDMAIWNFGVQEGRIFTEAEQEVFPGCPTTKKGYMYLNDTPGIGVDVNEKLAAKYPIKLRGYQQIRNADGTIIRP
jgi:mannonate dehydratase